jgi:hypothetical protein
VAAGVWADQAVPRPAAPAAAAVPAAVAAAVAVRAWADPLAPRLTTVRSRRRSAAAWLR